MADIGHAAAEASAQAGVGQLAMAGAGIAGLAMLAWRFVVTNLRRDRAAEAEAMFRDHLTQQIAAKDSALDAMASERNAATQQLGRLEAERDYLRADLARVREERDRLKAGVELSCRAASALAAPKD